MHNVCGAGRRAATASAAKSACAHSQSVCCSVFDVALVLVNSTGEQGMPFHLTTEVTSVHGMCIKDFSKTALTFGLVIVNYTTIIYFL